MAKEQETVIQFYERFIKRTAIAMLLTAGLYGLSAAAVVGSADFVGFVEFVNRPLSIVIMVILVPVFLKMVWLRMKQKNKCREGDSFVRSVFKDAASRSFTVTFLTLVVLLVLSEGRLNDMPPDFFINTALAVSLAICSGWFLYASRDDEELEDFDPDDAKPRPEK